MASYTPGLQTSPAQTFQGEAWLDDNRKSQFRQIYTNPNAYFYSFPPYHASVE